MLLIILNISNNFVPCFHILNFLHLTFPHFQFLKKYKTGFVGGHYSVLSDLVIAEQELSHLLNNAKIIRGSHHNTVLAKLYLREVWRLVASIKHYLDKDRSTRLNADLSDVHIVVEW